MDGVEWPASGPHRYYARPRFAFSREGGCSRRRRWQRGSADSRHADPVKTRINSARRAANKAGRCGERRQAGRRWRDRYSLGRSGNWNKPLLKTRTSAGLNVTTGTVAGGEPTGTGAELAQTKQPVAGIGLPRMPSAGGHGRADYAGGQVRHFDTAPLRPMNSATPSRPHCAATRARPVRLSTKGPDVKPGPAAPTAPSSPVCGTGALRRPYDYS